MSATNILKEPGTARWGVSGLISPLRGRWRLHLIVWLAAVGALGSCARRPTGLAARARFPVGTCVDLGTLRARPAYRAIASRDFSSITAETGMKMDSLQPQPHTFSWTSADALVRFARQHHQRVHGHTLVWHQALPTWLKEFKGDSAAWEQVFKEHIQTTVRHFRRRVNGWDVVNEAIESNGHFIGSPWLAHLGPGYVGRAFQYARQAAPRAVLFYNDYDLEYNSSKLDQTLKLLEGLKARGIRVDGIGFQMHTALGVPASTIAAAMRRVAALGYKVHVSELDVEVNRQGQFTGNAPTAELLNQQRQLVHDIVMAFRQLPAAQQYGITVWGVSDGDSWLRGFRHHPEWPLLYDDTYQSKPAYEGFREGLTAPLPH
jgi:endo-1,4-beta-xylanase